MAKCGIIEERTGCSSATCTFEVRRVPAIATVSLILTTTLHRVTFLPSSAITENGNEHRTSARPLRSPFHSICSHRRDPSLRCHTLLVPLIFPTRSGFRSFARSSSSPIFNQISNLKPYPFTNDVLLHLPARVPLSRTASIGPCYRRASRPHPLPVTC